MSSTGESHSRATDRPDASFGGAAPRALRAAAPAPSITRPYQRIADSDRGTGGERLANFLGLFSVGLGLAEFAAPGAMSKLIGIAGDDRNRTVLRVMGLREITNGMAVLSKQQTEKAMWARVAGDALDLAMLGTALMNSQNRRSRVLLATANVLAVAALDLTCARLLTRQPETAANAGADDGTIRTRRALTIGRPIHEVYAFWRDFENVPRFMLHLESVVDLGDGRSHWKAKAPGGTSIEWDAELIEDRPDDCISWQSVGDSDVFNAGTVMFRPAPGRRGTEVRVEMRYKPPFGKLGSKVAMLFREEPGQQVQDDLRHFKQVMEIGEIVLSDATKQRGPHPAQPDHEPISL